MKFSASAPVAPQGAKLALDRQELLSPGVQNRTMKARPNQPKMSRTPAKESPNRKSGGQMSGGILLPKSKITLTREEILADYRWACLSRQASLLGRKEVLTGKAKFGIFGDGKELPQLAMARAFQAGDFRSGYYRDQTFMMASGLTSIKEFFAQLYADPDPINEPASSGRMMNSHFATPLVDESGSWLPATDRKNTSADISPTAGQMARALGIAYASKLYRNERALKNVSSGFSRNGNEISFATIGDASTSEGIFFESLNAAGVLQVPLLMSVWDDGYGISVPREFQTTRGSISLALSGFASDREGEGFIVQKVTGWDYIALMDTYLSVSMQVRRTHKPALIHVSEITQPQGHSTSGSHERYKSPERLQWEKDYCCVARMRIWIEREGLAHPEELNDIESQSVTEVELARNEAWTAYQTPIRHQAQRALETLSHMNTIAQSHAEVSASSKEQLSRIQASLELSAKSTLYRRHVQSALHRAQMALGKLPRSLRQPLDDLLFDMRKTNHICFNAKLHSNDNQSAIKKESVAAQYDAATDDKIVDGRVVLLKCFEHHLETNPRFFSLGEDVGKLGDVNLVFEGLNTKFGDLRVTDTGIREATILGQGIGAALRGLRPLVDIQYLDYLLYALQVMSDDLATVFYRTGGIQKCPVVIRTKGHRLEGIWHTGSPIGMILHALRGMHVCVPRNMTQAAGMYNVLLRSDDPALVIEVLNGYRLKERVPSNVGTFQVALGHPEVLRTGHDLSLVTYGACCRLALEAAELLDSLFGVSVEVIDVQTLLPFDRPGEITQSLKKTSKLLVLDEDVPGGASAYILREILETGEAFDLLELSPRTLTAQPNRAAYASDGDYFCKPSVENIMETIYSMMREIRPTDFPELDPRSAGLWTWHPDSPIAGLH